METAQDLSLSKRDDGEGDVAMNGENSAPQVWSLTISVKTCLYIRLFFDTFMVAGVVGHYRFIEF